MNKESVPYRSLCTEYYELDKPSPPADALKCYLNYAKEARSLILWSKQAMLTLSFYSNALKNKNPPSFEGGFLSFRIALDPRKLSSPLP